MVIEGRNRPLRGHSLTYEWRKEKPAGASSRSRRLFDPVLVLFLYMAHQAALALDLASSELVFASLVGVAAGLEFDYDGCAA